MGWFCYLVCFSCLFGCGFGVVGGVGGFVFWGVVGGVYAWGFISFWVWGYSNCVRVVTENLYIFVFCIQ